MFAGICGMLVECCRNAAIDGSGLLLAISAVLRRLV